MSPRHVLWFVCLMSVLAVSACDDADTEAPDVVDTSSTTGGDTSPDTAPGDDTEVDSTSDDADTTGASDTATLDTTLDDTAPGDTTSQDTASQDTTSQDTSATDTSTDTTATMPDTTPDMDTDTSMPDDRDTAVGMCARWATDRMFASEGAWSGSVSSCDAGSLDATSGDHTLRQINLFRWLARLPPTTLNAAKSQKAQDCALMMDANGQLDHSPPTSWTCYSADGAEAAGKSNISPTPAVAAIDLYMIDPGNASTLGHRRWLLSSGLSDVGTGSTDSHSCLWVIGGSTGGGPDWTAWPPPGPFPLAANLLTGFWTMDETGWSIQSSSINLNNANVTITDSSGTDMPVSVTALAANYGSSSAISIVPQGWTMQVDTYTVSVTGVAQPFSYDVEVVDCN